MLPPARLINDHYHTIDIERRGTVESMRLMADEARALAREAREQGSEPLQVILDHIKDVVLAVDEDGVIRTFNPTGERVFGYDEAEVVGQRIDLLLPQIAESGETIPEALRRLAATLGDTALDLAACELRARRKEGKAFPAEIAVSKAPLARREMFVLCLRDVTERRESEQAVRDSEARYRLLVDHAPDAIVVLDVDSGRFVDANDVAQKLFGLERARLLELGPITLSPPLQPDGAPSEQRALGYIQQALAGEVPVFEWAHWGAAGREFICEVRLVRLSGANRRLVRGSITDICSERKRGERIAAAERKVFEDVTRHAPLPEVLASITRLVESAAAGTVCSVSVLTDERQSFSRSGGAAVPASAAPRARICQRRHPQRLVRRGGVSRPPGTGRGHRHRPVLGQERRKAARCCEAACGLVGLTPIKAAGGNVLGALGLYRDEPGLPNAAGVADHGTGRMAAGGHRHRAAPRRGSPAHQRGEVPQGLFESVSRKGSTRAAAMAGCSRSTPPSWRCSVTRARKSCTRCPASRRCTGTRQTAPSSCAGWRRRGRSATPNFSCARATASSW